MPVDELSYVEEHGTAIPELPAGGERVEGTLPPEVLPAELPHWEQETIEAFLKGTGTGIHFLAGVGEADWKMTEEDLERIAPPLTRICNRYEPILRMAPIADPLLVAHGFALYGWRSALERQRALRDREAAVTTGERYVRTDEPEAPVAGRNGFAGHEPHVELDPDEIPSHQPYFDEGGEQ